MHIIYSMEVVNQQSMNSGSLEWLKLQLLLHWVVYMELIDDRSSSTLLPIIHAHISPGTLTWNDQWAAYNAVNSLLSISSHQTVNHSIEFKNPS